MPRARQRRASYRLGRLFFQMARVENSSGRAAGCFKVAAAAALTDAECAYVIWNSRGAVASTESP